MSKHKDKDKERSRDDRYSRERERSRDRDRRRRSRSRSKDRHKRSKDRRRSKEKTSRRDRSRERNRSRSRERSRGSRSYRRSPTPPSKLEMTAEQQAHVTQFLSASLSGLAPSTTVHHIAQQSSEPLRTDFSNLFNSISSSTSAIPGPNASALAIAAAKAKDLLRAKNLTDTMKTASNGNSINSNGNESSRDADEYRQATHVENSISGQGDASNSGGERKRKKKSRWASSNDGNEKTFIPGMPTILPSNLNPDQQEAYLVQLQIEEISRKLRTGDLGISHNLEERSPSPEPIYSSDGKRLNTREFRTRKKLEEQRHMLITRMQCMNPDFKPPADYKPPVLRVSDKVLIPQEEHPDINFVGLLIGPRGNTLKAMEKETGAKIIIRGKGSVKEGKVGRKDGQPLPGEDEPLHAFITAPNPEAVKKAVDKIKEVIKQGIEVPEGHNDLRRMQLRELAQLNGTLRETDNARCTNCGSTDHKSWLCPDKPNVTNNIVCSSCGGAGHIAKDCKSKRPGLGGVEGSNNQAKIDEEYLSLMAELGEVQPQEAPAAPREPVQPTNRPYNIFDNPRNQAPRQQICAPPPPSQPPPIMQSSVPPPWHQNQHPPAMPLPPAHPMGQYPPPMPWSANPPLPPGSMNPIHPPMGIGASIPPPPGTDLAPPGTFGSFDDDRFGKKQNNWNVPPPIPGANFWNSAPAAPPLPSFMAPPPPPPE